MSTPTTIDPREPNNRPPTTINPDLAAERANTPFNPINITNFIDGNDPNITIRRRQLESWIIRDPTGIFSNEDNNYLHRTERHKRALAKFTRLVVSVHHDICSSMYALSLFLIVFNLTYHLINNSIYISYTGAMSISRNRIQHQKRSKFSNTTFTR